MSFTIPTFGYPPTLYPENELKLKAAPIPPKLTPHHFNLCKADFLNWTLPCSRVEEGIALLETTKDLMLSRVKIEEEYAAAMKGLANRKIGSCVYESGDTMNSVNKLQQYFSLRAQETTVFAQSIKTDVIENTINPMLNYYKLSYKRMKTEGFEFMKQIDSVLHGFAESLIRVANLSRLAEEAVANAQQCVYSTPNTRTNAAIGAIQKCLTALQANKDYGESCILVKDCTATLRIELEKYLNGILDIDRQRIHALKDAICRASVHETSLLRNYQYDFSQTLETCFDLIPTNEVNTFVDNHNVFERVMPPEVYEIPWYQCDMQHLKRKEGTSKAAITASHMAKSLFGNSIFKHNLDKTMSIIPPHPESNPTAPTINSRTTALVTRLTANYDKFWSKIWGNQLEEVAEEYSSIYLGMTNSLQRSIFCLCLSKQCRPENPLPNEEALLMVSRVCNEMLDLSQQQEDVWCASCIMLLSSRVRVSNGDESDAWESKVQQDPDSTNSMNLHHSIYSHGIWNRYSFWEEALAIVISENLQHDVIALRWKEEGVDAVEKERKYVEDNPHYIPLEQFSDCMNAFGVPISSARLLLPKVYRTLRLSETNGGNILRVLNNSLEASAEKSKCLSLEAAQPERSFDGNSQAISEGLNEMSRTSSIEEESDV